MEPLDPLYPHCSLIRAKWEVKLGMLLTRLGVKVDTPSSSPSCSNGRMMPSRSSGVGSLLSSSLRRFISVRMYKIIKSKMAKTMATTKPAPMLETLLLVMGGIAVGKVEGIMDSDGRKLGHELGMALGTKDGTQDGDTDGIELGVKDPVGLPLGASVGTLDGWTEGCRDGIEVGSFDGESVESSDPMKTEQQA